MTQLLNEIFKTHYLHDHRFDYQKLSCISRISKFHIQINILSFQLTCTPKNQFIYSNGYFINMAYE